MYIDMETVEEMVRMLETEHESIKESGETVGKPVVFIGQINEKNEEGYMRISVVASTADEDFIIRYMEPVGMASIPNESLKESKETELMFQRMKKDFDDLVSKVDKRKDELVKLFEEKEYLVFMGVLIA